MNDLNRLHREIEEVNGKFTPQRPGMVYDMFTDTSFETDDERLIHMVNLGNIIAHDLEIHKLEKKIEEIESENVYEFVVSRFTFPDCIDPSHPHYKIIWDKYIELYNERMVLAQISAKNLKYFCDHESLIEHRIHIYNHVMAMDLIMRRNLIERFIDSL